MWASSGVEDQDKHTACITKLRFRGLQGSQGGGGGASGVVEADSEGIRLFLVLVLHRLVGGGRHQHGMLGA